MISGLDWSPSSRPIKDQVRHLIANKIPKKKCLIVMPATYGFDIQKILEAGKAGATDEWRIVERDADVLKTFRAQWETFLPNAKFYSELVQTPVIGADFIYADLLGNFTADIYHWMRALSEQLGNQPLKLDLFITFSSLTRGNTFFKEFVRWLKSQQDLVMDITSKISRNGVELESKHLYLIAAQWLLLQSSLPRCSAQCYPYHDQSKMFLYHLTDFERQKPELPTEVLTFIDSISINYETLLKRLYSAQNTQEIVAARQALETFISKRKSSEERHLLKARLRKDLTKMYQSKLDALLE